MSYSIGDTLDKIDTSNWSIRDVGCGRHCNVTLYYDNKEKNLVHVKSEYPKDDRGSWTGKTIKTIINIVPWER